MAVPDWAQSSTQSSAPSWATEPASGGAPAWAQQPAAPAPPPPRPAGATDLFGQIGQTWQDVTDPNHPQHDPNALESGIIGATYSKPIQYLQGEWNQNAVTGLFAQPVRAAMEKLGVGRQYGESDASLHQRYGHAMDAARQQAQSQIDNNIVGSYGPNASLGDRAARFAQQASGVAAGVAANPQYTLIPGMGFGGNAAVRTGAAIAGNAAVGSVSDAAAQGMDMLEGQKKDFDIEQNLKSAALGGLVGGVLHGATEATPVVSDYVKSLFAARGMDTTPGANPTGGTIQPMTTDHMAMNQADHMQYQHLLNTGSVDDIKNFFKGRQGPQPSYTDINTWVEHRDGPHPVTVNGQPGGPNPDMQPDFNYEQEYNQHAEQQYAEQNRQAVEDHVHAKMAGWKNAPEVEVVHSPFDIADPAVREQVTSQDPNGDALGVFANGKVHLFSGRITDPDTASAVLYHEGLGHYGLSEKFGDRLGQTMQTLYDRNVGQFKPAVDAFKAANPGASTQLAAEEVMAEQSQNGQIKPSWKAALGATVKQFGRKMGLKLAYSDGEVRHVLSMAHDAVVNGQPSARANGFRGATQDPTKFMYEGQGSRSYPHEEARKAFNGQWPYHGMSPEDIRQSVGVFKGADGLPRREFSDHESHLKDWESIQPDGALAEGTEHRLEDVLHHPRLYEAYPEARDIKVTKQPTFMDMFKESQGSYNADKNRINVTPYANDPHSTILHEIQHWIQDKEHFTQGGNANTVRLDNQAALAKVAKMYDRKIGELVDTHADQTVTGAAMKRVLQRKMDLVQELKEDEYHLGDHYKAVDHADMQVVRNKLELERAREKWVKTGNAEDVQRVAELREEGKGLKENQQAALKQLKDLSRKYDDIKRDTYQLLAGEREARDTQYRRSMNDTERANMEPYSAEGFTNDEVIHHDGQGNAHEDHHPLGYEKTDPDDLDMIDRLKANPRYWTDQEYRTNVNEMARTRFPADQEIGPKFMRSKSDDENYGRLPLTEQDIIMNRRLRGMIKIHDDPRNPTKFNDIDNIRERYAREYGDVPDAQVDRISDDFKNMNVGDQHPDLESKIRVIDNRTGEVVHTAGNRRDAMSYIDSRNDGQNLGIARYGTNAKFATKAQINKAADPDYVSEDLENIYKGLDENYTKVTRSWDDERKAAIKAGFSPKQLRAIKELDPGELSNRLYRLQAAANLADARISKLNEKLDTPDWSARDQGEYIKTLADLHYLTARVKGERGEYARALRVAQAAKSYSNSTLESVGHMLEAMDSGMAGLAMDHATFMKFAKNIKGMMQQGNTAGAITKMQGVNQPYWEQYLNTFHMNMMLSALSTHVKAPIDMATGITRNVLEKVIAMPIGQVRQMYEGMTGKTPKPGVEAAELFNHVAGTIKAVTDAEVYRAMWTAAKSGDSSYVLDGKRTPTNFANQFGALSNPRIPVISKMTDLISAQDTFFRSVEMNAQLLTVATREARAQLGPKASTSDVMTLGHSLAQNPLPSMLKEAFDQTQRTLLLNDNKLNTMINKARTYSPGMTTGQRIGAFIATNLAPFIRVESNNLMNRIIQRSPLAFLDGYTREQLKMGGAHADIAMSKILYGTALLGVYWMLADKGKDLITGEGPDNVDKFKQMEAGGWQPNAIHENGRYNTGGQLGMSVNPFDVHNKTAQMVASARKSWEEGNQSNGMTGLMMASMSIMHNLSEMSWVSDFQPLVDAMTSHGTTASSKIAQFAAGTAKTWIPNAANQAARMTDVQRDTSGPNYVGNSLESAVPGMRENLPIKYSVYGTPLPTGASLTGVHTWIPGLSGNGTTETTDPTERELDRLNSVSDKTVVTPVTHTVPTGQYDDDGKAITRKLSPAEFETYQQKAGQYIVGDVRQEMASPSWNAMSDKEKVDLVKEIETEQKRNAREELFEQ